MWGQGLVSDGALTVTGGKLEVDYTDATFIGTASIGGVHAGEVDAATDGFGILTVAGNFTQTNGVTNVSSFSGSIGSLVGRVAAAQVEKILRREDLGLARESGSEHRLLGYSSALLLSERRTRISDR
jgi:hypothetical protein